MDNVTEHVTDTVMEPMHATVKLVEPTLISIIGDTVAVTKDG
jgi:hypothetical protein